MSELEVFWSGRTQQLQVSTVPCVPGDRDGISTCEVCHFDIGATACKQPAMLFPVSPDFPLNTSLVVNNRPDPGIGKTLHYAAYCSVSRKVESISSAGESVTGQQLGQFATDNGDHRRLRYRPREGKYNCEHNEQHTKDNVELPVSFFAHARCALLRISIYDVCGDEMSLPASERRPPWRDHCPTGGLWGSTARDKGNHR